jgi:molecular chaperone HscB
MPAPFFELFGLEPTYALDREELERRYLDRSKAVHPDRFAAEGAAKRVAAIQQSMELNEAYKTLKKPVSRAEYLLASRGISIGTNEQLDPGFLIGILEAREELASAKAAGDEAKLAELEAAMARRRRAAIDGLATLWQELETSGDEQLLVAIKREIILLRYLDRYLEQFDDEDE